MAYQLEKKALKKVNTLSATDYIALINNVEKQKNAGNVLITWADFLLEVGLDLTYIKALDVDTLTSTNTSIANLEISNSITMIEAPVSITNAGAIPLTNMVVMINTLAPTTYTLPAGTLGQYITLIMRTDTGDATVTPSSLRGYTSIKLTAVGASVTLWYDGAMWNLMSVAGGITLV